MKKGGEYMDEQRVSRTLEYLDGIGFKEWGKVRYIVDMRFHVQRSRKDAEIRLELEKPKEAEKQEE